MQRLRDLRQYVTDLTSCLAAVRQGTLFSGQAAQAKQCLIEGHLWLAVALVKRSSVRSLAPTSNVDKKVIGPFVRLYWDQQGSEQERLEAACTELEAEGIPVTMVRLCSRAHVGSRAAAAFLKNYHPVVRPKQRPASGNKLARPAKASLRERLSEAYTHLVAQGEKVTRARLRQEDGVSTDAARAFLRELRADDADQTCRPSKEGTGSPDSVCSGWMSICNRFSPPN